MLTSAYWEPILVAAVVNAIVAVGVYITLLPGQLSAAHGALMGVGAYGAAVLTTNFHWPFWAALAVGAAFAGVAGGVIALPTARMPLFIQSLMTLAFGETLSIIAYNVKYLGGAADFMGMPFDTTLTNSFIVLVVVVALAWLLDRSRVGVTARAVRDNESSASALGISIIRIRVLAFVVGGAIAGLGGGLSAHYTLVIDPSTLAFQASFNFLVFVLVGGSFTVWGGVFGAALLTILPEVLRFSTTYRFALYGLAIVAVVMLRPEGIFSRKRFQKKVSLTSPPWADWTWRRTPIPDDADDLVEATDARIPDRAAGSGDQPPTNPGNS